MRPGYPLIEAICKAGGLPTDRLVGLKLDAWDPNDPIVLTTQYIVGIVNDEIEIKEQRWVPEETAEPVGWPPTARHPMETGDRFEHMDSGPIDLGLPDFDPHGEHVRAWAKAMEDQALRNMGIDP